MSQENLAKARDYIAAYNRRDFDAAVENFDPEIEWVLPARQSSDSCRGPDEIRRFWANLDDTFKELRLDPQEFVVGGDHVATRLRYYSRGKGSGVVVEGQLYHQLGPSATGGWSGSSTSSSGRRPWKPAGCRHSRPRRHGPVQEPA